MSGRNPLPACLSHLAQFEAAIVRRCAETVLDVYHRERLEPSPPGLNAASRNQALFAYHAIMCLIEPNRPFLLSIEEARGLRP